MSKNLKNPYLRSAHSKLPIVNPLEEINEEDLYDISGGKWSNFKQIIISGMLCYVASSTLGNDGWVCTATVECQGSCN